MSAINHRIVLYMQTEGAPTRSAIESTCPFSGEWHITGIWETERAARAEVARRQAKRDLLPQERFGII